MSDPVQLEGGDQLVARLERARAGLVDLSDANRAAVRLAAGQADRTVPRASGRLADSQTITVTATGWGIGYTAPYAVPVHAVRPWLTTAARATEDAWMDTLTDHVQQLLN